MANDILPPTVDSEFLRALQERIQDLENEVRLLAEGRGFINRGVAPAKPANGTLVLADGVGWNPGSGAGFYERKGGVWVKL